MQRIFVLLLSNYVCVPNNPIAQQAEAIHTQVSVPGKLTVCVCVCVCVRGPHVLR